jgi:hypothetical protein
MDMLVVPEVWSVSNVSVDAGGAVNESVVANGSVLGCEFSGSTVSREIFWGRLVLGLFCFDVR